MDNKNLENLRHSTAHLLAAAVTSLWSKALPTIGPVIENGFYYDFDLTPSASSGQEGEKITEEDFPKIEAKMHELVKSWNEIVSIPGNEYQKEIKNNPYKQELIAELKEKGEKITIYKSGGFEDLCRGGHIDNPKGVIKYFKLMSVAGAYWRGDEKNKMLTRIYGTAFFSQEELDKYLEQLKEAEKRDHRKLGRELDLFYFSELVGPGLPLFTPKGATMRRELENFVQSLQEPFGYTRVLIPHLAKIELYKKSGHWFKYKENMFQITSDDGVKFAMKPMNCPHHIELFGRKQFSYRDLPQRYSEVTAVYRQEKAGELLGLSRVYMLTQDDAHVFCTEEQAIQESLNVYKIIKDFYAAFDFGVGMRVRLSLRDPKKPYKYLGDGAIWKKSETMMREVAERAGLEVYDGIGEAAFYAPKLDFMAYDSLGREWQLATIQLDLNFADRFDLKYVDSDGTFKRPVIIHRAILGSVERFMSILIEHYAGNFPTWLTPVQVKVLPISEKQLDYAREVEIKLKAEDIRVELDERSETLGNKIRQVQAEKVAYMLILGDKEKESNTISVRSRTGEETKAVSITDFINQITTEIKNKSL